VRARYIGAAAAAILAAVALTGCSSQAGSSELTVTPAAGSAHSVSIDDVTCLTVSGKFTASSAERVGDLPQFVATATASTQRTTTWLHLDDDSWFMSTGAFTHDDGTVTFDGVEGKLGTSSGDDYPTQFDGAATIEGTVSCTSEKEL